MSAKTLLLANMVNEVMTSVPGPFHARGLNAVSPRKLWLSAPGDIVVLPVVPSEDFKDYVFSLIEINPSTVKIISTPIKYSNYLPEKLKEGSVFDAITEAISTSPYEYSLLPFTLDRHALTLAELLGIPVLGYDEKSMSGIVDLIYRMNTKSGFREVAQILGFRVPEGRVASGTREAIIAAREVGSNTGKAIVKFDRSSNGYGHVVLENLARSLSDLETELKDRLVAFSEQPYIFVVEEFLSFQSVPSVEIEVTDSGPRLLYLCDQRCPGNSFTGMISPPFGLTNLVCDRLTEIGLIFGEHVAGLGYRGVCDVDCGVTEDGSIVVTESNFRRTGGTYLHTLVNRMVGDQSDVVWGADSRLISQNISFTDAQAILSQADLSFSRNKGEGIILTADTFAIDSKVRSLTIARSLGELEDYEHALHKVLK
jgi:hypothetical protein